MLKRLRSAAWVATVLCVVFASNPALADNHAGGPPDEAGPPFSVPDPRSQAAIDALGARLPDVARAYGLSVAGLRALFLSDDTLSVDQSGKLFYVERVFESGPANAPPAEPPAQAPPTTDPVFSRHSRQEANHVIYLDFDGHTTTGTVWNSSYGIDPILSPPYDIDGNTETWSAAELSRIDDVWRIVAEDFSPFDVDVTTEAPPVDWLINSGGGDTQWGVRVVVTDDTFANCGCGGFAYIDSFNWNTDTPVFVFNSSLVGVSEASSHEAGHALGLAHDGTNSVAYYQGHGSGEASWAPLMGASYSRAVTQWSKGEYWQANNNNASANYGRGPDDLVVITTYFGFGYRADDHGNSTATATTLSGSSLSASGVIEQTSDVDFFSFSTGGGSVILTVDPVPLRPNLNVLATLLDATGTPVAISNSTSTLSASFNLSLAAGTYYLEIDGTGTGTPLSSPPTGYTEYGSLGQYSVSGTLPATTTVAVIGDYGVDNADHAAVAGLVNGWNPDAVVTAGDNRYGSTTYDQVVGQFYCDFLADVLSGTYCSGGNSPTNRFFPATGNHDYTDGAFLAEYLSYFDLPGASITSSGTSGNERYYDFVVGPIHFFAVDSQGALTNGADMTAQQNWLQAQMSASTSAWQVVLMHHPPYSSGQHQSSTAMRWPYAAWGADAVIAGHDHNYERISHDGIPYFVNGSGGKSLRAFGTIVAGSEVRYNADYDAMLIDGYAGQLTFQFVNRLGQVIDTHTIVPTRPGVVDVWISDGDDDVEERTSDGVLNFTSTDLEFGADGIVDQTIGILFRNVPVPQGATITSAYLEFNVDEVDIGTTDVVIRAEDADSAASFALVVNNVTSRTTTSASVAWSIPAWGVIGAAQQSPELAGVVQEVVDRGGWSSGNNLVFVIDGTGERTAESYNGSPGDAPRLHIEYTITPNKAPTAGFTFVTSDLTATFTDTSTDGDGTVVSWAWDFGDTNTSILQDPVHVYVAAGTFTVSLTVTDDDGATSVPFDQSVTVTAPNNAPTAGFTFVTSDLTATFTDTSSDGDGTVVSWAWDFGDTNTSILQDPVHVYGAADTYTVSLTVTDDDGAASVPFSQSVTVTAPPPPDTIVALEVTDGWDDKNQKTLVEDGKLAEVLNSDNNWIEVESSHFTSFQFEPLPAGTSGTITSVVIHVEHHEESGYQTSTSLQWDIGGGSLQNPTAAGMTNPTVLRGEKSEATGSWDVVVWVNSTSAVDGMKFVVRNNSTNGKKTKIDHIYAEVFLSSGAHTTPPETSITSGPGEGSLTNVDSASLGFSSSEGGSSFECDLDAGGWGPCISPESYVGLADGSHTFMVRATDAATNTDPSPASRTWTVDTAAPAAPLINAPVEDALLASSTVLVSGTAEADAAVAVFEGATEVGSTTASGVGAWSVSVEFGDGAHAVTVVATDGAGNLSPASTPRSFTVDTTPPDTSITSGPAEVSLTNSPTASLSFTSTEGGSTFECSLDGGGYLACTSPEGLTGLANGAHTFMVRATDPATNTDPTPATRTWTVDATAPQVTAQSPLPGAVGVPVSTTVTVTFDEDMDPGTITGTSFTLETTIGSVLVPATVGYNVGSRTATLTPTTALAVDTNYTARVTTAATDLAGNPLATNTTWAYQTSAGTSTTLFLHNSPTPPAGDTTAQPNMGMDIVAPDPTATTLYEYSTDYYSGAPGRYIEKSDAVDTETDTKYMANWVYQGPSAITFSSAEVHLWVAMKDLKCDKTPEFTFYLMDDTGTVVASGTGISPPEGSNEPCDFRELVVTLTGPGTTVTYDWLELKVLVNESTGDSALIAYDTVAQDSRLVLQ